ncbi:MAG TPA: nucleoside hydrolase [Acidimicrobiales bacterium]|nr:nucleoside hydrolase [Acidimicrobiales bacterium]
MSTSASWVADAPVRVILDCDTKNEIDDQVAIAYALGCPRIDVVGVISVQNTLASGPDSVEIYQEEAERIVALSGREDVPCLRGASSPMEHIDDVVPSDGLEFLLAACEQGPIALLGTGPATDIAAFVQVAPRATQERVQIIWAGGFPDPESWNEHKFGELNARADIAAWRRVFQSAQNLTVLTGWPAVETVKLPWTRCVERFRELRSPLGNYLADLFTEYAAHGRPMDMDVQREGDKVLWDIVNVAAVSIPEAVTLTESVLSYVDPAGVPDWNRANRTAPFALEVDSEAILDDLWRALERLPKAPKG